MRLQGRLRAPLRWQPRGVTVTAVVAYGLVVLAPSLLMLAAAARADAGTWASIRIGPGGEERIFALGVRSLAMALVVAALAAALMTPAVLLGARVHHAGFRGLALAAVLGLALPPHVHAMAWHAFWPDGGTVGAVISLVSAYGGWALLAGLAGVLHIDPALEDAARLQVGEVGVLRRITLPLIRPHVLAGFVLVFVFALTDYGVPALWQINTYPVEVFALFSALYDERAVALLSLPFVLVAWLALLPLVRVVATRSHVSLGLRSFAAFVRPDRTRSLLMAGAIALPVPAVMVIVPVVTLLGDLRALSTVSAVLQQAEDALAISVGVAAASATAAVLLCWPLAYVLARSDGRWPLPVLALALLSVAMPAPVVGVGMIRLWTWLDVRWLSDSLTLLCLAHVARIAPLVTLILFATVRQVNVGGEAAALLISPSWGRRMVRIVLPQARAGLAAAWLGGYVLSLAELGATLLVIPPGFETLSLRIYNLLHYGASPIVAMLALTLAAAALFPLAAIAAIDRIWTMTTRHSLLETIDARQRPVERR